MVPNQYFSTRLSLAQGLIKAGGGVRGAAFSLRLDTMIRHLGVPWAFQILGFMALAVGLPAAWIVTDRYPMRPTPFIDWRLFRDSSFLIVFFAGAVATFALHFFCRCIPTRLDFRRVRELPCWPGLISLLPWADSSLGFHATTLDP